MDPLLYNLEDGLEPADLAQGSPPGEPERQAA